MPTGMPHTGIEQNLEYVKMLDMRMTFIPEVDVAVGKWGRVNSALDPAPTQMFENLINYKSEYILDANGHRKRFKVNSNDEFLLSDSSVYNPKTEGILHEKTILLVEDRSGNYFRQWREHIKSPDDIWNEIVKATEIPGLTAAPKLQPIQTRLVMLSTGLRAPMGLKVFGPNLESIEEAGLQFEKFMKEAPEVIPASVFYDRSVA
ncbi:MAG TPA: cation transporter, partial [Bacteroidales bacterium]|nr:cation transporter [Bacteroidales bacterium]